MFKGKLLLVSAAIICVLVVSAAPAAAKEFKKVGHAVTSVGGTAVFAVSGASVTCTGNTDTGKVTNANEVADEVSYTGCKSSLGTSATVETCKYIFFANESATLVGGCKTTSSLCTITPSTTANKELKAFTNIVLKEAELESEVKANVTGITYAVNLGCQLAGIKAGKEGTYKGVDVQKGVILN